MSNNFDNTWPPVSRSGTTPLKNFHSDYIKYFPKDKILFAIYNDTFLIQ